MNTNHREQKIKTNMGEERMMEEIFSLKGRVALVTSGLMASDGMERV